MLLSILIPVYNEEKTIKKILEKVSDVKVPKGVRKEIVIVNDGSTDKTKKILQAVLKDEQSSSLNERSSSLNKTILKNSSVVLFHHDVNRGKGSAIRTALGLANGDYLIVQDADLEYDPADYSRLLDPILKGEAQVVYGTRLKNYPFRLWGKNKTILPSHWVANKVLTGLTNLFYGSNLTDMETCYKVFQGEALQGLTLRANKFDFEPEITAKLLKKGINIYEVEIKTTPRTHKEGKKIRWQDGFSAVWALIKYRFVN